jgi:serine O-acetyltransferase
MSADMAHKQGAFASDLEKYYRIGFSNCPPGFFTKLNLWINHLGLHCVAMYRFGQFANRLYHKNAILGFIPMVFYTIFNFLIRLFYHVDIDAAIIGPGLYIGHIGCIYIGNVTIGKNFSVTHNVTIGQGHSEGKEGRPESIGDNVWIGTGSVISGAIIVGNNVTIAPGTFLSRTIPDGCLVGGNPAHVLAQNYNNSKLFGT